MSFNLNNLATFFKRLFLKSVLSSEPSRFLSLRNMIHYGMITPLCWARYWDVEIFILFLRLMRWCVDCQAVYPIIWSRGEPRVSVTMVIVLAYTNHSNIRGGSTTAQYTLQIKSNIMIDAENHFLKHFNQIPIFPTIFFIMLTAFYKMGLNLPLEWIWLVGYFGFKKSTKGK